MYGENNILERLDFFLVSQALIQLIESSAILPAFMSDHSIPWLPLLETNNPRGTGFWKLNTSLLYDSRYLQIIDDMLQAEQQKEFASESLKWEMVKLSVRGATIQYATKKKKDRDELARLLEVQMAALNEKLGQDIDNTGGTNNIHNVQTDIIKANRELEEINKYRTKGVMLRCKANWLQYGEKMSKYFSTLEKHRFNKKTSHRLRLATGNCTTDPTKILQAQADYHRNLCTSANIKFNESYLEDLDMPKLTNFQRQTLDKVLDMEEIEIAMKQMKSNKSPGTDGLPREFYKTFWPKISNLLYKVYQEAVEVEKLHISARRGVISLLEKTGRDPLLLKNWRPISLLNVDYKILAKAMANRLRTVLPDIIHLDQTGFMKNRYIGENILDLLSTMEFAENNDIQALIIGFDFEKAFDHLEWNVLQGVLRFLNFGPYFCHILKILNVDIQSTVTNNGFTSEWFNLTRATRQGGPLSLFLFNVMVEILGTKIRKNRKIEPINSLGGNKKLHCQYADDIWVSIKYGQTSYDELLNTFQDFTHFSGLKINYDKTQVLQIGSLQN